MKSIKRNEVVKEKIVVVSDLAIVQGYSLLLQSERLSSIVKQKLIPMSYESLIRICELSEVYPEETVLFNYVIEVRSMTKSVNARPEDDSKLNLSSFNTNYQQDLISKNEGSSSPDFSVNKLGTTNQTLHQAWLQNDYATKHRVISFIFRCIYALYYLYGLLLLIEIIMFYVKHKAEFLLFEGLSLALIVFLIGLASFGLYTFKRQRFNWLIYLDIAHVVLIGLVLFTMLVPIEKIATSEELYQFLHRSVSHLFLFISLALFQAVSIVINVILLKQVSQLNVKPYKERIIPLADI